MAVGIDGENNADRFADDSFAINQAEKSGVKAMIAVIAHDEVFSRWDDLRRLVRGACRSSGCRTIHVHAISAHLDMVPWNGNRAFHE